MSTVFSLTVMGLKVLCHQTHVWRILHEEYKCFMVLCPESDMGVLLGCFIYDLLTIFVWIALLESSYFALI